MGKKPRINGVRIIQRPDYLICHITNLSGGLKGAIRDNLSKICHGVLSTSKKDISHNYQNTLKEFLGRYRTKTSKTKKGMIGELLTHIIILKRFPEYSVASAFFNLEEKSIKKGFDVILFSKNTDDLWLTEVKCGEVREVNDVNKATKSLIHTAKRDLNERLNEQNLTLWYNALNGARIALRENSLKKTILKIIQHVSDDVAEDQANSDARCVILVAGIFCANKDVITEETVQKVKAKIVKAGLFKKIIIISIKKRTYSKVVDFLKEELD